MPDEIEELSGDEMGGGGGGGREAKDEARVFWQATSLADHLPKFNTGGTLQFFHGQRSVRKGTPDVNGVFPGTYTDGEEVIQRWDGVNMFKYYKARPVQMDKRLQQCDTKDEGGYSLSGVSMKVSDWPRSDGCHNPNTTEVDEEGKVITFSSELHTAFEHSHEFEEYSFECVEGVSKTSTAYNFFMMTAQHECFCPGIMTVAARLLTAAEQGRYVVATDFEDVATIRSSLPKSVVDEHTTRRTSAN